MEYVIAFLMGILFKPRIRANMNFIVYMYS
jgi:hypothetical protein